MIARDLVGPRDIGEAHSPTELEGRGWPRLSAAQSLLFAHADEEDVPPATLARRLSRTLQATGQLVDGLVRLGLLWVDDNPGRRGRRLVCLTGDGRRLAQEAYDALLEPEQRLGDDRAQRLQQLLSELDFSAGSTDPSHADEAG